MHYKIQYYELQNIIAVANLRFINGNGKIKKILSRKCNINLIISGDLKVALLHDLHKESMNLQIP